MIRNKAYTAQVWYFIPEMQELVFEIPLSVTESDFPIELLRRAQILYMLKFDSSGYLFICKMPTREWELYNIRTSESVRGSERISIKLLEKMSGSVLLQVAGRWFENRKRMDPRQMKELEFFRSMERSSYYGLGTPAIIGNAIRFSVVTEAEKINKLLNGLKQFNIPHKVNNLGRLRGRGESILSVLTFQQTRVLRLAHTMGYYDIPRRASTEDLARALRMNKATVGEHLRRAEKNIFDKLIVET